MLDHTRAVIGFLNALDDEIDEYGQEGAPTLMALLQETNAQDVERLRGGRAFSWNRSPPARGPKTTKIQYSREQTKIRTLMTALGVGSAKAVGEATFDIVYEEQNGDEE